MRTLLMVLALALVQPVTALPNKPDSLKFVVLANAGTGKPAQHHTAAQMTRLRGTFKYDLAILAGGNISGSERPHDFLQKFEEPYKTLLASGVTFRAALGSGDSPEQRYYKLFNMQGHRYYTFSPKPGVRFFALDSQSPPAEQLQWLEQELSASTEPWKIAFFHDAKLRALVDPLFVKYQVRAVLAGNEAHAGVSARDGIAYIGTGFGDRAFLAAEIAGDELFFNAVAHDGQVIGSGVVRRQR